MSLSTTRDVPGEGQEIKFECRGIDMLETKARELGERQGATGLTYSMTASTL